MARALTRRTSPCDPILPFQRAAWLRSERRQWTIDRAVGLQDRDESRGEHLVLLLQRLETGVDLDGLRGRLNAQVLVG